MSNNNFPGIKLTPDLVLSWYSQCTVLPFRFVDGYLESIDYEATRTQNRIVWEKVRKCKKVVFRKIAGTKTTRPDEVYDDFMTAEERKEAMRNPVIAC